MKKFLLKILPDKFIKKIRRRSILRVLLKFSKYDIYRFSEHSSLILNDTQAKHIAHLVLNYHVIEKGLTMPEMKPGFGKSKLNLLIDQCLDYQTRYNTNNVQYKHAVSVIKEYDNVHKQIAYVLDKDLQSRIDIFISKNEDLPANKQIQTSRNKYFKYWNASFREFAESRHSVRNLSGHVDQQRIFQAIQLAQTTPSSCNRQPSRVYIIDNKEKIETLLDLQKGSRGFKHLVDKLLIVTADLSVYQSEDERNCAYVDGGMYVMNLLYALHYYKMAACSLNWCKSPEEDIQLRKYVKIPDNETVIIFIACGDIPEEFMIASSTRNNFEDVLRIDEL